LFDFSNKSPVLALGPLQIGLVGDGAGAEKAVDRRQGNAQAGGVLEAGESVFETRIILRRPVRPAGLRFFLLSGRKDDVRRVGLRPIDAVVERERGLLAGGGSVRRETRRRLGGENGRAARASRRRPLTPSGCPGGTRGSFSQAVPPFSSSATSASLASAGGVRSGRARSTVSMPARQRSSASIADAARCKPR
jgi:hypothetical protein